VSKHKIFRSHAGYPEKNWKIYGKVTGILVRKWEPKYKTTVLVKREQTSLAIPIFKKLFILFEKKT